MIVYAIGEGPNLRRMRDARDRTMPHAAICNPILRCCLTCRWNWAWTGPPGEARPIDLSRSPGVFSSAFGKPTWIGQRHKVTALLLSMQVEM